jgi:hypothetical protein
MVGSTLTKEILIFEKEDKPKKFLVVVFLYLNMTHLSQVKSVFGLTLLNL